MAVAGIEASTNRINLLKTNNMRTEKEIMDKIVRLQDERNKLLSAKKPSAVNRKLADQILMQIYLLQWVLKDELPF